MSDYLTTKNKNKMKKQYLYICLLLLIASSNVFAQEVDEKNKSVKLYTNFHILNSREASIFDLPDSSGFHFHNLSFAFAKDKKDSKRFREFEISFLYRDVDRNKEYTNISIDSTFTPPSTIEIKRTVPVNIEDIVIGLRFELGRWWKSFQEEKIRLGWSSSFRVYTHFSETSPQTSQAFPTTRFQAYLKLSFIPRVQYNLSPNLYLDLNFPIEIISTGVDFLKVKNPSLTEEQQKQGGGEFNFGGEVLMRFGVGYRF